MAYAPLLCALALVFRACAADGPTVVMRVVNSAGAPSATVKKAELQAARVLDLAGVAISWKECAANACREDLAPREYWMRLVLSQPAAARSEPLGFTLIDANPEAIPREAGICYPAIWRMAEALGLDEATVVAATMAHEIGHLLGLPHSPIGLMSSNFNRGLLVDMSQGSLRFNSGQASRMRAEAFRRAALPPKAGSLTAFQ